MGWTKREVRVAARGLLRSQASRRATFKAAAVATCCRWVLVVHPLSCCGIWHDGDPGAARDAAPPSTAPDEGMLVRVPVRSGAPDGFFDLGPGLEAAALQCQRAQDLPPRLD